MMITSVASARSAWRGCVIGLALAAAACSENDGGQPRDAASTLQAGGQLRDVAYTLQVNGDLTTIAQDCDTPALPGTVDCEAVIEMVDLENHLVVGGFTLPDVYSSSLAVSGGGDTVFLVDAVSRQVRAYGVNGNLLAAVPLQPDPIPSVSTHDLALSDGGVLYVIDYDRLHVLDTGSMTSVRVLRQPSDMRAVALDPGDSLLAVTMGADGGTVFETASMTERFEIPFPSGGCNETLGAVDVAFAADRLLVVNGGCTGIQAIDLSSGTTAPIHIAWFGPGYLSVHMNRLHFVEAASRAYTFDAIPFATALDTSFVLEFTPHSSGLQRINMHPTSSGARFHVAAAPSTDGTSMYFATGQGPVHRLDRLDLATRTSAIDLYTFSRQYPVKDMKVIRRRFGPP